MYERKVNVQLRLQVSIYTLSFCKSSKLIAIKIDQLPQGISERF